MKTTQFKDNVLFASFTVVALFAFGCGEQPTKPAGGSTPASQVSQADNDGPEEDPSHNGWWCVEHGVPEEECSMCGAAAKFKEKGDWCEEHSRAKSQCFICDPSRADKFAKLYEAKFGHKPPKPAE